MQLDQSLEQKYSKLTPLLDERSLRLVAAADCVALKRGGISAIARASGLSRPTLNKGIAELKDGTALKDRIRRPGGGRKRASQKYPGLEAALEALVEPSSLGDPASPLQWTTASVRKLAAQLNEGGYPVSHQTTAETLHRLGYSLQVNTKALEEGSQHPDRNAQFEQISRRAKEFMAEDRPVISVDTKKKELIGQYKNAGRQWHSKGQPTKVKVHDFIDPAKGKAIPYGVYDVACNQGWVNVGQDHDTAAFAVESIRRWWLKWGRDLYPKSSKLLICADGGGSNGYKVRLWKKELQSFADESGMEIHVCHLPPGTSKWNKIEHRLFSYITINWRGRPLTSHEAVVDLIASTTTEAGLKVGAEIDRGKYPDKIKVTDKEMAALNLVKEKFHGEWNYALKPRF